MQLSYQSEVDPVSSLVTRPTTHKIPPNCTYGDLVLVRLLQIMSVLVRLTFNLISGFVNGSLQALSKIVITVAVVMQMVAVYLASTQCGDFLQGTHS